MLAAINNEFSLQALALLQIDGLQLAFPQHQIASVNLATDMDARISDSASIGWIVNDKKNWPIYAISNSLEILSSAPEKRRFCICFHPIAGRHYIGLVVDAIVSLKINDSLIIQALPDCMQNSQSPVTQIVKNKDKLIFMSDADYMYHYIEHKENQR